MKRFIIIVLILFITSPLFSDDKTRQENAPVFTNEDLEKYKNPSEKRKSFDDVKTPKDTTDFKDSKTIADEGKQKIKRYEVSYKAYEGMARRIIISVKFNDSVTAPMVLDTGATGMHISVNLAEKLGLFEKDEGNLFESTSGIGGTIPAILTIIDKIQVDELEEHFVPTKVSRSFSDEFEGLVGMDFMANFSIQIDTKKHVVAFEEHPINQVTPGGHDEEWWRTNFHQFAVKREEWKKLRREIFDLKDVSKTAMTVKTGRRTKIVTVGELREFADRQYKEADKLLKKLDGYAIDHAVPMEWREY
jgi:hypothetical protein